MPHVFDGRWRSVLIEEDSGPRDDLQFNLEVDPANNRLKPSSTHQGQLTGDVTDYTIRMTETFPQIPTVRLTYDGNLCGEVLVGTQRHLLICGVFTLIFAGPLDEKSIEAAREIPVLRRLLERSNLDAQEQEIWVATKP